MKTVDAVLFDALIRLKEFVVNSRVGRPDLKPLLANEFQTVYELALDNNPSFFTKGVDFPSTTSIDLASLAPDFRSIVLVETPTTLNAGCYAGAARDGSQRSFDNMQQVSNLQGTIADPLYLLNSNTITLSPAMAGTLYYLPKYDDSVLTVDTTDLEALIPRFYIKDLTLGIMQLAIERYEMTINPASKTSLINQLERLRKSKEVLKEARRVRNLAATDTPASAELQAHAAEGGLLGR